jgi:type IV secretory pathway TrbL component
MLASRRIAAVLTAIGALAASAPVAGASAAMTPGNQPATQVGAAQDPWSVDLSGAQSGFAAGAAAAQSGVTMLRDAWARLLTAPAGAARPYHAMRPDVPQP